jgi:hypothetical protein
MRLETIFFVFYDQDAKLYETKFELKIHYFPLRRSKHRWEDNVKMYFREIGCGQN